MVKPRILCLHGFTSNGSVHAYQVRTITTALSSEFEFIFPDGPHKVDMAEQGNVQDPVTKSWIDFVAKNSTSGHRAWWFARDPNSELNEPGGFHGLEKSLDSLNDAMKETGPVDAIWGFSQGACFAGMLISLLSRPRDKVPHPLRSRLPTNQTTPSAGIFVSGFKARFQQYDSIYESGISVPTLHVLGVKDKAVTPDRSESLIAICHDISVLKHQGSHNIPSSEEDQAIIINFLREKVRSRK